MLKLFSGVAGFCFFGILTINLLLFPSCKKYDNTVQIRRIDTLINWNNNAKGMLIIDAQAIKLRTDSMKIKINAFDSNFINSTGKQFKSDLVLYNGLLNRYNAFIDNYADVVFENSVNSRFLEDLKKKIIDHQIPDHSMDTMLNRQEKVIRSHLLQTQEIVQTIFSVEEMYQRLNNRINFVYGNMIVGRKLE
jgi:hypothetical protein